MKQRLPTSEIERLAKERNEDLLLQLIREVCPHFLMKARHLQMKEEEVLIEIEEILTVAKSESKERSTQYFESLYERLFYEYQCCAPSAPENEIHVVVGLIVYLAAALLFFYDEEESSVLMHRYADDISINAAKYTNYHNDVRNQLFARLDTKADVLSQIVTRYIVSQKHDAPAYPVVTDLHKKLFEQQYKVEKIVEGRKIKHSLPVPLERVLHTIYDITRGNITEGLGQELSWAPNVYGTSRNWAIMYRVLKDYGYIPSEGRPKYALFLDCVIRYCYVDVKDSFKDTLGKYKLSTLVTQWDEEDHEVYKWLRKRLNFIPPTSAK